MANLKCKMCGGSMEVQPGQSVAVCEYCGTMQTLPKLNDDRKANLYDRASHFRRNNEFDRAVGIYEQILAVDETDAESYWSLVLCRYGIEYVEDPISHKRVPTVNRTQTTSIFADVDYLAAIRYADGYQRSIYEAEAKEIDRIQKGILAVSQQEEPFDIFICYKETDSSGHRTVDSVLAMDLYKELTAEGYRVFFSRVTLEDKLGTAYEPYIFAALNSAKVMVVVGTRPENFNAVWVRNEWSRYLALIRGGAKKYLIPAYKDMDPYDLPEEFSHLQAQDMSKLGFTQDLIHGIKKLVGEEVPVATQADTVAPLLRRAFLFLEDGDWESADVYCEKVLDLDPENGQAYLGKLLAALHVHKETELATREKPFDDHVLYEKVLRFGDDNLTKTLKGYSDTIREREQQAEEAARQKAEAEKAWKEEQKRQKEERLQEFWKPLKKKTNALLKGEEKLWGRSLLLAFTAVVVVSLAAWWMTTAHDKREAYAAAVVLMTNEDYAGAADAFEALGSYKDSAEQKVTADQLLEKTRIQEEQYIAAVALMESEDYANAVETLKSLGEYKDAAVLLQEAELELEKEEKYQSAVHFVERKEYQSAIDLWDSLGDYRDSREKYIYYSVYNAWLEFQSCINAEKNTVDFDKAASWLELLEEFDTEDAKEYRDDGYYELTKLAVAKERGVLAEQYLAAITETSRFEDYKTLSLDCNYVMGLNYMDKGAYMEAVEIFSGMKEHRDSLDRWMEAMYTYVQENRNASVLEETDVYTQNWMYLHSLENVGYKDSAALLKELFKWKVTNIRVNSDPNDNTTNKESISKQDPVYFHFDLEGGPVDGAVALVAKITYPTGWKDSFTFPQDHFRKDNCYGWEEGIYITPDSAPTGTLTVDFYDEEGNCVGSGSVEIVD